jgi:hypothetical protein
MVFEDSPDVYKKIEELKNKYGDKIPPYVACIAEYENKKRKLVRISLVITDLNKNEIIHKAEYWKKDNKSADDILDEWFSIIKNYQGCVIIHVDKPVRLEKCGSCDSEYTMNFVSFFDYVAILEKSRD